MNRPQQLSLFNANRNAILALGHIAVALQRADGEDNTKAVLKFLLQWFDSNSASSNSSFSAGDHAFEQAEFIALKHESTILGH